MTRRVAIGALWMVLFKVLERSISLISTLILARLLLPRDFGIVAMGTSLIALLELISAFGLETALIQRRNVEEKHYNGAWTLNIIAGAIVGVLMIAIAVPASHFYREPNLVLVVIALGICAIVQGFENIRVVDFRRNLEFDREFRYLLTKKVIGFTLVITLAIWLRSFWALVLGNLVTRVLVLVYSFVARPCRPRFSMAGVSELLHFSKWMVALNVLQFLRDRSGDFVLGRTAGPRALGTFSLASQLASLPSTELVAPINRVLLPAYAKLSDDLPALARQYLAAMGVIATIAVPAVAGVAATAPFLVLTLLGKEWLDAIPVLEILSFFGITQVLQTNAYSAFLAIGRPGAFVRINAFHAAVLLVGLFVLTPAYGMLGAAWAFAGSAVLALPVNFVLISRYMKIRVADLLAVLWRPLVGAAVMYGVVRFLGPRHDVANLSSLQSVIPLVVAVLLGFTVYVAACASLWMAAGRPEGAESWLLVQVRALCRKAGLMR